jgi:hypothetical protein
MRKAQRADVPTRCLFLTTERLQPRGSARGIGEHPECQTGETLRSQAAVVTYIRNSWGNAAAAVSGDTVGKIREQVAGPSPWR